MSSEEPSQSTPAYSNMMQNPPIPSPYFYQSENSNMAENSSETAQSDASQNFPVSVFYPNNPGPPPGYPGMPLTIAPSFHQQQIPQNAPESAQYQLGQQPIATQSDQLPAPFLHHPGPLPGYPSMHPSYQQPIPQNGLIPLSHSPQQQQQHPVPVIFSLPENHFTPSSCFHQPGYQQYRPSNSNMATASYLDMHQTAQQQQPILQSYMPQFAYPSMVYDTSMNPFPFERNFQIGYEKAETCQHQESLHQENIHQASNPIQTQFPSTPACTPLSHNRLNQPSDGDSDTENLEQPSKLSNQTCRTRFLEDQLKMLNQRFSLNPHIKKKEKIALGLSIGLTEKQVATWFKHKRDSVKRRVLKMWPY